MEKPKRNPETFWTYETEIGLLTIACREDALVGISFGKVTYSDQICSRTALSDTVCAQLQEYFKGERRQFDLPLEPHGTIFQRQVWDALCAIPYGETCCYEDIAGRIGNPKAVRAVGMANNRNPIPIIIPCHRVIGKNGGLVGYAGGLELKQRLLDLESGDRNR